jgi:hypothetical protein
MKTMKKARKRIRTKGKRAARAKPGKARRVDRAFAKALEGTLGEWNSPADEAAAACL